MLKEETHVRGCLCTALQPYCCHSLAPSTTAAPAWHHSCSCLAPQLLSLFVDLTCRLAHASSPQRAIPVALCIAALFCQAETVGPRLAVRIASQPAAKPSTAPPFGVAEANQQLTVRAGRAGTTVAPIDREESYLIQINTFRRASGKRVIVICSHAVGVSHAFIQPPEARLGFAMAPVRPGNMQHWPLLVHKILDYAAAWHPEQEIITKTVEGITTITTYADLKHRAQLAALALQALGIRRVGQDG
ncbi:AMP-binding domain-containing protein [Haematococcus lacustris]|uniref:AMP-binding domain-containing protein n=1 Tax=Haematococcus lacustris TaxID=44745 RepID=A0A699ZZF2_HAELA|nr:AMP-binding domain-containing protein [Haematococcus lacustris]